MARDLTCPHLSLTSTGWAIECAQLVVGAFLRVVTKKFRPYNPRPAFRSERVYFRDELHLAGLKFFGLNPTINCLGWQRKHTPSDKARASLECQDQ